MGSEGAHAIYDMKLFSFFLEYNNYLLKKRGGGGGARNRRVCKEKSNVGIKDGGKSPENGACVVCGRSNPLKTNPATDLSRRIKRLICIAIFITPAIYSHLVQRADATFMGVCELGVGDESSRLH